MQGPSWIALFTRIPNKLHDTLALTLVTGAEILMQSVLRLESDFAIIRGRMSGSTDAGRVIILPYDQIVNLAFTKRMLEPEVKSIFGAILEQAANQVKPARTDDDAPLTDTPAAEVIEEKPPVDEGVTATMRTAANQVPPVVPPSPAGKVQPGQPSKSMLLARLRARLAEHGK